MLNSLSSAENRFGFCNQSSVETNQNDDRFDNQFGGLFVAESQMHNFHCQVCCQTARTVCVYRYPSHFQINSLEFLGRPLVRNVIRSPYVDPVNLRIKTSD